MKKTRLEETRNTIAVTGYACHLPGIKGPEDFWSVLTDGRCVISEIQRDRFDSALFYDPDPNARGRIYTKAAGQIENIWAFDPGFFNISHREAAQMDPQQRLLLMAVWEALAHAGLATDRLDSRRTGVFVGASSSDYSNQILLDMAEIDAPFMTGNTLSIISNRISYLLDLKGPSYTVDTACSSSFYAFHQACQAIENGSIDTAIVGGVNLLLSPGPFVGFSRASMLSPDGLCKAFDASANGYVRSEGAVAVVLRRQDLAKRAGDPVRSIVVGSGVNSDGRTVGMALPSADRQAALLAHLRETLEIDPEDLAFVEAHGTGTAIGDPIEAHAVGTVLATGRSTPLPIGSAKSNIGHLEPASGLVGFVKAQMALERGILPKTLHIETPNPTIDFEALNLDLVTEARTLPEHDRPLIAGINSFGFGGANAHIMIRQPKADEIATAAAPQGISALPISAASAEALRSLASAWRSRIAASNAAETGPLVNAAVHRQTLLPHRLIVDSGDQDTLLAGLDAFLADEAHPALVSGKATRQIGRTAFVFCGNGAQWAGMGRELYDTDSAFKSYYDTIADHFVRLGDVDIRDWMQLDGDEAHQGLKAALGAADIAQPYLFGVQMALAAALAAQGLQPDAVTGHSVGEVAAACTAGIITLSDACRLIHTRSHALNTLRGTGSMAVVSVTPDRLEEAITATGVRGVGIAGLNSPRYLTISGPTKPIKELLAYFRRTARIAGVMLDVEIPYHSPSVEPLRRQMLNDIKSLSPQESEVLYASSTTGQLAHGKSLDTDYWWRNTREVVRFDDAIGTLCENGVQTFIEMSPKPTLAGFVREILRSKGHPGKVIRTMEGGAADHQSARTMVARALVEGAAPVLDVFFGPKSTMGADLPRYPWTCDDYRAPISAEATNLWGRSGTYPLLGRALRKGSTTWIGSLDCRSRSWLADHKVDGGVVLPAAAFVEMALAAGREALARPTVELADFEIIRALTLDENSAVETRVSFDVPTGMVRIEARPRLVSEDWSLHAFGTVRTLPSATEPAPFDDLPETEDEVDIYPMLSAFGLDYGPNFALATDIRQNGSSAWVAIDASAAPEGEFALNPACLDAAMHAIFPLIRAGHDGALPRDRTFLPVRFGNLRLLNPDLEPAQARVTITRSSSLGLAVDLDLRDADANPVAFVSGLRLRATPRTSRRNDDECFWHETPIRLRAKDKPVSLPRGWSVPAARIAALGLGAKTAPEPDSGALLIDAATRRIAHDACATLADPEGNIDLASPDIAPDALPLVKRLLAVLETDEAVTSTGDATWSLTDDVPYPELPVLLSALHKQAPNRAVELLNLSRLETTLPTILIDGLPGDTGPTGGALALGIRKIWQSTEALLGDIVNDWPDNQRLDILVVGHAPAQLIDRLLAAGRIDRLSLTSNISRICGQMRQTLTTPNGVRVVDFDQATNAFSHDVILIADTFDTLDDTELEQLSDSLALSGLMFGIQTRPALATDLLNRRIFNQDGHQPELESLLDDAFRDVHVQSLNAEEVEADLVVARPRQRAVRADMPAPDAETERGVLLVLADPREENLKLAALIGTSLAAAQIKVERCIAGDPLPALGAETEIIHLAHMTPAPSDVAAQDDASINPLSTSVERIETLRPLLHANTPPARIWMLTRGAWPGQIRNGGFGCSDATVSGALRVMTNEYPRTAFHSIDVAPSMSPEDIAVELCSLVVSDTPETEVFFTGDAALAPRVEALTLPKTRSAIDIATEDSGQRLIIQRHSALESLAWEQHSRQAPGEAEVEIEIVATGLNFRDLMWAQGLLPEEALEDGFAGATLGMECSGRIVRAGSASGFEVGDSVIAFAPACFSTHVTVHCEAVSALPSGTDLSSAAAVPTIFVTAQYALSTLANVQPGEIVLVHGGAGGVGFAALQIARRLGARIFATAGSPAKRQLLLHLGAEAVFDSRSLAFADEVMDATGGAGVDVVLNSLAGEAMERSLACLKPFGRFVELGKRDYYANTRIGLRPFRRNLSYFGVDADQLLSQRPDLAGKLLDDVAEGFASEAYFAPPCQVFEASEIVDAFRLMQQSRHIGKILVKPPAQATMPVSQPVSYRDAWLIVGGLGGFGLATASWLANQGVRKLWLTSRTGTPRASDADALAALEATGCAIETRTVDATDITTMSELLRDIELDDLPLRGVIHAAMVLNDAFFKDLTPEKMSEVIAPKLSGALALDRLTRAFALDQFILYSSVTTLFGNPGQVPYVGANAALESIAAARKAEGLPGVAIGFGPIADHGYLARDERTRDLLGRRLGGRLLTADEALAGMAQVLSARPDLAAVTVAPMRWRNLATDLALLSRPLFARIPLGDGAGKVESIEDLRAMLAGLEDHAAIAKIAIMLSEETARILRQPVSDIDVSQPLTELGFDSLMAMDLKLAAEESLGITVPLLSIADGMTLNQLAARVLGQIRDGGDADDTDATGARLAAVHVAHSDTDEMKSVVDKVAARADKMSRVQDG